MPETTDDLRGGPRPTGPRGGTSRGEAPAARRPRRGLLLAGLLLGAAAIGMALSGACRRSAHPAPAEGEAQAKRAAPDDAAQSAPPAHEGQALPPPAQTPVPETYDALKQEALAAAARLRERYPNASEAVGLLAWMHDRFGNTSEATRCWREWLAKHPDSAEAYFRLGRYAKDKGDEKEAVECLQKAFKLDPTLPGIQVQLGELLTSAGRPEEAVAVLEADAAAARANPHRMLMLGHAYLQTQQYEKAKEAFRKVLEVDPKYGHAYYGLAAACTRLGQAEEAKKYSAEYAKLKDQGIVADRARAASRLDDLPAVRQLVTAAHATAGRVYAREGDPAEAERHWLRAAAIDPADTQSRRALAELYRRQGRTREAARVAAELRTIGLRQGNADDRTGN